MDLTQKSELGQFYTSNSLYMLEGMLDFIPFSDIIIDPFAGNWDLLNLYPFNPCAAFDIVPLNNKTTQQDTILNPPDYTNKWVVTNPPYLARNKNKNKSIYDFYRVTDLYKAAIKTIIGCKGGILIVPINFLSDLRGINIRVEFLSQYVIKELRIFEEQVFNDTTYTVCAFSFIKEDNNLQVLKPFIFPECEYASEISLNKDNNYLIGGDFFSRLENNQSEIKISRLVRNQKVNGFISNILLRAVDSGSMDKRIKLELNDIPFYGKVSDRVFATLVFSKQFSINEQEFIINEFNRIIEEERKLYHSLFLTNYRNSSVQYARKRISFDLVYKIISYIVQINKL